MLYLNISFSFLLILLLACIISLMVLPVAGQNEGEVIIGKPEIGILFAAQYSYYQSQSAGSVSIKNNTNENLRAETIVTVAGYAEELLLIAASLPAGKTTQVPLKIAFNLDKLPTKEEPLVLDAEVEVSIYCENEQLFKKRLLTKFQLHNLHILPDEPDEAVAVFIDAGDQSVAEFAQVEHPDSIGGVRAEQLRDNSKTAQRLFELMQQAKIICLPAALRLAQAGMKQVAKTVWYPRELLGIKLGSSYDCALLYAALLENSNVPVALMVSDEYILVLFQQQEQITGQQEPMDREGVREFVSWKDKFWIPIDIRMLQATFSEAEAAGMQAYENLKEGKVKPFILREAWEQYKPVRFVSPPSVKEMQLGITYVQRGEFELAEQIFNRHLNSDASAAAYNNLGNISFRRGNYKEAENLYLKAIEADSGDGAIYLNIGIVYAVAKEDKKAEAMFDRAFRELGSYSQMCYALGIKHDGLEHMEVRLLLREAEERVLQNKTRPLGVKGLLDNKRMPLYWKRR
jgi:tetratricopeptide (TPR) repeat protein